MTLRELIEYCEANDVPFGTEIMIDGHLDGFPEYHGARISYRGIITDENGTFLEYVSPKSERWEERSHSFLEVS
jgi:hypothetical protein